VTSINTSCIRTCWYRDITSPENTNLVYFDIQFRCTRDRHVEQCLGLAWSRGEMSARRGPHSADADVPTRYRSTASTRAAKALSYLALDVFTKVLDCAKADILTSAINDSNRQPRSEVGVASGHGSPSNPHELGVALKQIGPRKRCCRQLPAIVNNQRSFPINRPAPRTCCHTPPDAPICHPRTAAHD
jgi:hypothetical protein